MSTTSKGQRWEILHSLWILWTFTFGFFNWVAFFYIGIRAKQRKWILWGLVYAIPFILAMAFAESSAFDGWIGNLTVTLTLILGIISIVHAFRIRKEYLLRLEALQRREVNSGATLRDRVNAEYSAQDQRSVTNHEPARPSEFAATQSSDWKRQPDDVAATSNSASSATSPTPKIDLNNSSEQEISSLPGIGLIIAKRTVMLREERGGFHSIEEFGQALNLKPHIVERIRPLVVVSPRQPGSSGTTGRVVDF